MKIAISSEGKNIEDKIDIRFGRCKYFIIVDSENNNDFEVIENQGALQGHGAGIKAAQQLGELEINIVITGDLGPNATNVLNQLNIKSYHSSGSIKTAIQDFINDKLEQINEIGESHKGMNNSENKPSEEKIFFPLLNDNGLDSKISEHFGHAPFFGIYDVEKKDFKIIKNDLDHVNPNKSPIDQIQEAVNPTTIFAKGIGGRAIKIIEEKGLLLKTGDYNTVKEVIVNLDKLENQTTSCGHEH